MIEKEFSEMNFVKLQNDRIIVYHDNIEIEVVIWDLFASWKDY